MPSFNVAPVTTRSQGLRDPEISERTFVSRSQTRDRPTGIPACEQPRPRDATRALTFAVRGNGSATADRSRADDLLLARDWRAVCLGSAASCPMGTNI